MAAKKYTRRILRKIKSTVPRGTKVKTGKVKPLAKLPRRRY